MAPKIHPNKLCCSDGMVGFYGADGSGDGVIDSVDVGLGVALGGGAVGSGVGV